jgi:hypothetical protein
VTTTALTSPISAAIPALLRKKRVLLVDTSSARRELRAETMRKLGIDVDCAADILEARCWWRADLYNLVLMSTETAIGHRDEFCEDMRKATPPQQLAFLVGKPGYLADFPHSDEIVSGLDEAAQPNPSDVRGALSAEILEGAGQRWGILEASRRISAVRSLSHARSKAMRERPTPVRDVETRHSKRAADWAQLAPELQKEGMQ